MLVLAGIVAMSLPRIVRSRRLVDVGPALSPAAVLVGIGVVPSDSFPIDSARVLEWLGRVEDPELGFSIVELGLLHHVAVTAEGGIAVTLVLTTPDCPFSRLLASETLSALESLPGAGQVRVEVDPTIAWDPSLLKGEARARYQRVFGDDSGAGR